MSENNTIDHLGFVDSVDKQKAIVKINSQSACAACHAKGACSAADQEEKTLTVDTAGLDIQPGEQVRVLISKRTGLRAVAFGYVYPFLLLMLVLITLTVIGFSELQAGLLSLAVLLPYYLGLFLLRKKIENSFVFKLQKIYNDL